MTRSEVQVPHRPPINCRRPFLFFLRSRVPRRFFLQIPLAKRRKREYTESNKSCTARYHWQSAILYQAIGSTGQGQMRGPNNCHKIRKKFEKTLVHWTSEWYYRKAVLSADDTHHGVWKCALKRFEARDVNNSTDVRNDISLIRAI